MAVLNQSHQIRKVFGVLIVGAYWSQEWDKLVGCTGKVDLSFECYILNLNLKVN